ncbi:hypothetical protein J6590_012656 [Homalodisca vitripennis]|nr:hypothetical protein J6590_012656 [Homalodisca vitripennis]
MDGQTEQRDFCKELSASARCVYSVQVKDVCACVPGVCVCAIDPAPRPCLAQSFFEVLLDTNCLNHEHLHTVLHEIYLLPTTPNSIHEEIEQLEVYQGSLAREVLVVEFSLSVSEETRQLDAIPTPVLKLGFPSKASAKEPLEHGQARKDFSRERELRVLELEL